MRVPSWLRVSVYKGENMKKKSILSAVVTIMLCLSLTCGATFALFTSESKVNIAVNSATVNLVATVDESSLETSSFNVVQPSGEFQLGGTATVDEKGVLTLERMAPGDKATFKINVENKSDIPTKYRILTSAEGELAPALEVTAVIGEKTYSSASFMTFWKGLSAFEKIDDDGAIDVSVYFPDAEDNDDYQAKSATLTFVIEAVQGNVEKQNLWSDVSDISWFTENPYAKEYTISTPEQLAGLAKIVDRDIPQTLDLDDSCYTFEGDTIYLNADVDLAGALFNPIGYGYDIYFKGTFDGQGHTISNMYQNGWELGYSYGTYGGGLFASVVDATIKNVNVEGAEVVMECVDMGILVGYSYGTCTYENITVSNSTIQNYQRYTGGVVGEVNGTQTFKNVDVASDVEISGLWGDFDTSLGGIIGGKWGDATLTFKDCDVACIIDAFNDVTSSYQWYAYRRAGMLIGNSEEITKNGGRTEATASYLTATNCTVTYGDWVNYTYCEFAGRSWPYVRVQAGLSNSAYSNPRYGHPVDANGNVVVDDNHVHNEGEDHFILCAFDQLFGGGQGVYGSLSHDGVEVIYPN